MDQEDKNQNKKAGGVKRLWYEHKLAVTVIGAVVAIATSVTGGILMKSIDSWQAPKKFSAKFEQPKIESNVVLKNYLEQFEDATSGYTPEQLEQIGYLVRYQLQLDGFEGRACQLRWELFDAETKSQVQLTDWDGVQDAVEVKPQGASDLSSSSFWVPAGEANKPFFVRIIVCDDQGNDLTYIDTEVVTPPQAESEESPEEAESPQ